jgi:hypothetical protein
MEQPKIIVLKKIIICLIHTKQASVLFLVLNLRDIKKDSEK